MSETIAHDRELDQAYQRIASDPRYAHFINIPERIIRCLDYFGIACDRTEVRQRLRAYYLFIGVADEAIDAGKIEMGEHILARFHDRVPSFDQRTSRVGVATEVLKQNIGDEIYPAILTILDELYRAVVTERKAGSIAAYIEQRKIVGSLTAELSYLLIRPFLDRDDRDLRTFLRSVGAVGCLVDSVIDLRADTRLGLVSFKATIGDFLILLATTASEGISVSMRHPALLGVFLEAVSDNVRDRSRVGSQPAPRFIASPGKDGVPSVV